MYTKYDEFHYLAHAETSETLYHVFQDSVEFEEPIFVATTEEGDILVPHDWGSEPLVKSRSHNICGICDTNEVQYFAGAFVLKTDTFENTMTAPEISNEDISTQHMIICESCSQNIQDAIKEILSDYPEEFAADLL